MVEVANPALSAFLARLGEECVLGQVLLRRKPDSFELRHVQDRQNEDLKTVPVHELRAIAQHTAEGAFRPLKSAPNLQAGWRAVARDEAELEMAVNHLYPGVMADNFVAQQNPPPVTHYREFTNRQTGMYRITQMLNDEQAGRMIQACCDRRFCLKQRFWTVEGLAPDKAEEKSGIACLEPCAILLEFARKAMRIEQAEIKNLSLSKEDLQTLHESLGHLLEHPPEGIREADFGASLNPRRIQLLLAKLGKSMEESKAEEK
jgi:hypothetical protein